MSNSMKTLYRNGHAMTRPLCPNDFACTRYLEDPGQVFVQITLPILIFLLYGRRSKYLGATGVPVGKHSFHPHSNSIS